MKSNQSMRSVDEVICAIKQVQDREQLTSVTEMIDNLYYQGDIKFSDSEWDRIIDETESQKQRMLS